MKIDKQAFLHLFTTATTAMAAVLPQQYHDDVAIQPNPKTLNNNYLFNDDAASSAVVGHPRTATSTSTANTSTENPIMDTSVRKSDQVLANKKEMPSLDTDADVGILEFGAVFPSYKTMSYHPIKEVEQDESSEVQQRHRRLEDFDCPDVNCPFMANDPFSLNSDDTLSCNANFACQNFVVENFASGSTITCGAYRACQYMETTGTGTISCSGSQSCRESKMTLQNEGTIFCASRYACVNSILTLQNEGTIFCADDTSCFGAEITLQNGGTISCVGHLSCDTAAITLNEGRLECGYLYACIDSSVTLTGSSFVECRTIQSCGQTGYFGLRSTFIADSDGGTLLCKDGLSCFANFDLGDFNFLLVCEDSLSCASASAMGTENTCVVCAQENSCTQLDNTFFEVGANKTQPQLSGQCSDMQIDTACTLINSTLASSLTFCQTSPPSASLLPSITPSESFQPSLVPSIPPSESSQPSLGPSITPSESSHPSLVPSIPPSESFQPSLAPSIKPSSSFQPSLAPSIKPSESSHPSLVPSIKPSSSSHPSLLPSTTPSESSDPSLVPSMPPSESSHPSLLPSITPSESSHPSNLPTGKPLVGKPTIGKKSGSGKKEAGSKKGSYGGKKKHPETWSGKKEITKVEDIEMREP